MSEKLKVHIALFIVSAIYGATFTIAKEVMPLYIKPYAFILLRVSVASVLIFFFHQLYIQHKKIDKDDYKKLLICAVFGVAANMLMFFKGLSLTKPINGAVLMLNTPIFVIVFAWIWLKEKVTILQIAGIIIAAIGALLLISGGNFSFESSTLQGDILVTLNAISYAFYLVYAKELIRKYHPITVTLWSFVIGTFLVLPFAFNQATEIEWSSFSPKIWAFVAFITVGSTFFTYVLNAYALKHASSSLVGTYIYLQPVIASIIAIALQRDELNLSKFLCMVFVFAGVYLASFGKSKKGA